jgi:hypothetical protein
MLGLFMWLTYAPDRPFSSPEVCHNQTTTTEMGVRCETAVFPYCCMDSEGVRANRPCLIGLGCALRRAGRLRSRARPACSGPLCTCPCAKSVFRLRKDPRNAGDCEAGIPVSAIAGLNPASGTAGTELSRDFRDLCLPDAYRMPFYYFRQHNNRPNLFNDFNMVSAEGLEPSTPMIKSHVLIARRAGIGAADIR